MKKLNVRNTRFPKLARFDSLLLLIVLPMAALWLSHLQQSLWLDELQTAWVVSGSFTETAARAFHTQGFTPFYYFLIWALRPLLGLSEIGLRIPSVILTAASVWLVFRIAATFLPRRDAAVAATLFICLDGIIDTAITARPYSLALFLALLSFYSFERWLRHGQIRFKALYILSTLLTLYAHFLFSGIVAVELLYFLLFRSRTKIRLQHLCGAFVFVAIGAIPTIPQIQSMLDKRDLMAIARLPSLLDYLLVCLPWLTVIAAAVSFFLAAACQPKIERQGTAAIRAKLERKDWIFLAAWMLLPATLLFAGSYILGTSMFVARYFEWASPGAALMGAALYSQVGSERTKTILPLVFVLFSIAAEFTKEREPEDWRSAVQALRAQYQEKNGPILYYSGVIESSKSEWLADPMKQGQFLSPILFYQVSQPVFLLPFEFGSQDAVNYWSRTMVPRLPASGRVYVLLLDNLSWTDPQGGRVSIKDEIKQLLSREGFSVHSEQSFKRVWIMSLDKATQ